MKKITLLFIFSLVLSFNSYGQCTTNTGGQWPTGTITLLNSGGAEAIASNNWPNAEFSLIENVLPGSDYTVAATPAIFITVTNTADASVIAFGSGSVSFTADAGVTGLTIFWHLDAACGTQNSGNTVTTIQCTTCACTETEAPSAATNVAPLDGAMDIVIDDSDPANLLITPFSWDDGVMGGSIESTNLSLGITAAGNDIGTITGATNGNGITFNWEENTTYFWFVESVNCFGSTTSPVWSFTTTSCTSAAPDAVSTVTEPADMATDVVIDVTDPAALLVTPFTWVEPTTGDAATSYNLSLGVTPAGNDIGTVTGAGNGNGINFTWEYSTTYFWFVESVNCGGVGPASPVWSFTTEADPNLSVDDFESNTFTHNYSKVSKTLQLESSNMVMTNIEIYSILGQSVISKPLNNTSESIDVSSLNDGVYLAKVFVEGGSKTIKFVKN
jgi:hypothetical protein